jgi:hypothetical protein
MNRFITDTLVAIKHKIPNSIVTILNIFPIPNPTKFIVLLDVFASHDTHSAEVVQDQTHSHHRKPPTLSVPGLSKVSFCHSPHTYPTS